MRFELFNFSERALEQWKNYDELFDNLTHWLGETENKLKEHTELQGSLEDKKNVLHKQKDLHEEVILYSYLIAHIIFSFTCQKFFALSWENILPCFRFVVKK